MKVINIRNCLFPIIPIFSLIFISAYDTSCAQTCKKSDYSKEIAVEETWTGFDWQKDCRKRRLFDSSGNCTNLHLDIWNGTEWENNLKYQYIYDNLHYNTSTLVYFWTDSSEWNLFEGYRSTLDTLSNKGKRIVLSGLYWDDTNNQWVAEDSVFYDKKGRIIKTVSTNKSARGTSADTVVTIETIENIWRSNKYWIESSKKWRSDTKKTTTERCRYRMLKDTLLKTFAIDYWDKDSRCWIPNTARLFRNHDTSLIVTDSVEELIGNTPVPMYVSSETYDRYGNVLLQRYWHKSLDQDKNTWSGNYYKWERKYNENQNRYTIAESTFIADSKSSKWQLINYQKSNYLLSGLTESIQSGKYKNSTENWDYQRTIDTLISCGITVNGKEYYDFKKQQWIPLHRFAVIDFADSTIITTECLNTEKNQWEKDSMFVVQSDKNNSKTTRTNYVWIKTGLFSESWTKASKITLYRKNQ